MIEKYNGISCPACGDKFESNSDIVVCPECATPQHRECYKKNNRCANHDKHSDDFVYKPSRLSSKNIPDENLLDYKLPLRCPHCGAINDPDSPACQVCGTTMVKHVDSPVPFVPMPYAPHPTEQGAQPPPQGPAPIPLNPFTTPFGGLLPDDKIDEVNVLDIAVYVGENSSYYIPRFKELKSSPFSFLCSINFASLILGFVYFLYRKMYLWGAILLCVSFIHLLPNAALTILFPGTVTGIAELETLFPHLATPEVYKLLSAISQFTYIISMILHLTISCFANRLYMEKVFKDVKAIKSLDYPTQIAYNLELSKTGRVNRYLAAFSILACFVIYAIIYMVAAAPLLALLG